MNYTYWSSTSSLCLLDGPTTGPGDAYTLFEFSCFHVRQIPNSVEFSRDSLVRCPLLTTKPYVLSSRASMHPVLTWFCRYRAATAPATSFTSAKVAALDLCLPIRCLQDRPAGKFISRVRQAKLGRTGQLQGP